jgi:hypothetical protein
VNHAPAARTPKNTVTGLVLRRPARSAAIDSIGASPDPPAIMMMGRWDSRTFSCPNGPDTRSRSPGASRSSTAAEKAPPGSTRTTRSMDPDCLGGLAIENARVAAVPGTSTVTELVAVRARHHAGELAHLAERRQPGKFGEDEAAR